MVKWLLIDMNSFFASCAQQDHPRLRNKPIAVVPMMNVNTTAVLAASYEAKKFGIKTGTYVGDAKKMCPNIEFVPTESERYVYYHDKIAEAIDTLIPIEHVLSIDEFACELKGSQCKNEAALQLSKEIKIKIERDVGSCLTTSIGIAENILLAKVGSDLQKPNGLVLIDSDNREKILNPLSVRMLSGIGQQTENRLNLYNIKTISDLYQRSEEDLKRIWGSIIGSRYYHWIRGKDIHRPYEKNKSLGHQHVLNPKKRNLKDATLILKTLLLKGAARLRRKGLYASRMSIDIKWLSEGEESSHWEHSESFPETQDSLFLIHLLDSAIENGFADLSERERARLKPLRVGVGFTNLTLKDEHQGSLFEDEKRHQLLSVFDQINEKYGKESITLASVHGEKDAQEVKIAFNYIPDKKDFNG